MTLKLRGRDFKGICESKTIPEVFQMETMVYQKAHQIQH